MKLKFQIQQELGVKPESTKGAKGSKYAPELTEWLVITLFFTGLAYGGWMWSEVIYDHQVISSFVVLQHNPPTSK